MRCLSRAICSKIKRLLLLYVILAILIVIIILIHQQPFSLLYNSHKNSKSFKYASTYPGSFMENYKRSNESYCNFMYNLPEEFSYEESDLEYSPELGVRGPYRVLYNIIRAKQNSSSAAPVTYATHLTPDFVSYITEVVRYWEGPVSVAAYVPDFDADILTKQLINLCQCLPAMSKVSVHYVFPKHHTLFVGKLSEIPSTSSCAISDVTNTVTYRNRKSLLYPVNVCRNVARNASTTNFVLVSDVELIPSRQLASRFSETVSKLIDINFPSRVFVVPVFEIENFENVPRNKKDLLTLVKQEKAVYFHRHICSHCQKFPGIEQWLDQDPGNIVKLFAATTRVFPYHRWEPVYIGTKNEPFYSELLSWEGKQDKMTQVGNVVWHNANETFSFNPNIMYS
ncbi:hypothetical protein ILUMI_04725 [Ignelater luminosus]|uniref:N-acetyllactosaminide beta-1,3-N-acetylglucosaminyltransferase n=1 Tax=Ignelater luminosus TaxID=2038154 RepID=A0A8K0DDR3_IGNLU|nr:hypothetical protein ILUMI_04725 [Ignelater luminosus]